MIRAGSRIFSSGSLVKNHGLENEGRAYNLQRFYGPRKYFCYAPFRSVFVSYNGRVSPCYACKAEASLKQQSLEEIWKGESFENLRKQLSRGIIPDECSFCRGHLKNGNYGSILAAKYDHHAAPNKGFPAIMELELGNECNLECVMCCGELSSSIRNHREQKSPVESIVGEDFMQQFDFCLPRLRAAEFTGGDPFLIPVYEKLWERIEQVNPGMDLLITTNANTMNEKVRALLKKNLKLSFNISIDSLQKPVYEKIRQNARFENALANIGIFANYAHNHHTSVGFLVCPLQLNRFELHDFIEFADQYGATLSYHVVFKPAHLALWTLPAKELETLAEQLKKHLFTGTDFRTRINARNYAGLVDLIAVWAEKATSREVLEEQKSGAVRELVAKARMKFRETLSSELSDKAALEHQLLRMEHLISLLDVGAQKDLVFVRLSEIPGNELVAALTAWTDREITEKLSQYHNNIYYQLYAGEGLSDNDKYELSMKGLVW